MTFCTAVDNNDEEELDTLGFFFLLLPVDSCAPYTRVFYE